MNEILGIDLGNHQCNAATLDRNGNPVAIPNERGEHTTPSVIHRNPDTNDILLGKDAEEQGIVDPKNVAKYFKRRFGTTEPLFADGESFTAEDAATEFLRTLKRDAERFTGVKINAAVVCVPANTKDGEKQAVLNAAKRAELRILQMLFEPNAAAIAYGCDKGAKRQQLLVFDWGGGTFDVACVQRSDARFEVQANGGISICGGVEMTKCIANLVLDEVERQCGKRPAFGDDLRFDFDLMQKSEAAKLSLGRQSEVPIVAYYNGNHVVVAITQKQYHAAIDPLIDQTLECLDQTTHAAGWNYEAIDRLLLAGGSCLSPYVQERVADQTGLVPKAEDALRIVSYGAALAAGAELKREGKTPSIRGHVIPMPEVLLRQSSAHAVGCCVIDKSTPDQPLVLSEIVPRNTPIPCMRSASYYLEHEDQSEVLAEILEGEPDAARDDCLVIGKLTLNELPAEDKRSERIKMEFEIDRHGMVKVTMSDSVSKKSAATSFDYKGGMTANG